MFIETDKKYTDQNTYALPFVIYTVGHAPSQPVVKRPHGYEAHHILLIEQGSGVFCTEHESFTLREGEGFFCRSGVTHSYKSSGGKFCTTWFTFMCSDNVLDYYSLPDYLSFKFSPILLSQINELYNLCRSDSTVLSRSAAGYSLLADWLTENFEPSLTAEAAVKKYLENNCNRPLTLDEVAEHVGMSRYTLCHYYKTHCGCSVMEQLRNIRIAKAKRLLNQLPLRAEEVGRMCGFDSASYFCKIFREETGYTPLEYRKIHTK